MNSILNRTTRLVALSLVAVITSTSCSRRQETPPPVKVIEPVTLPKPPEPEKTDVKPPEWLKRTFGEELVRWDGTTVSTDTLAGKKVGIYFSAHWCPPCRTFSPVLVEVYNALKEQGKNFEVVMVSSDKSKDEMFEYMKDVNMPWLAIPYDSVLRTQLTEQYTVEGIPTLIIVRETGHTVTKNGRGDVSDKGADAFKTW